MSSHDIERTSELNQDTGNFEYAYFCSGKRCPVRYIESPIAKKYIGYDLIFHDLESAKNWINLACKKIDENRSCRSKNKLSCDIFSPHLEGAENEVIQALFISSVTYYGKCFTSAEGRRIKLEESNLPAEFLPAHKKIMEFRNTIAAHSGEGPWDTGRLALIEPVEGEAVSRALWSELKFLQFHDDRDEEFGFLRLIEYLEKTVDEKMSVLRKNIFRNITE